MAIERPEVIPFSVITQALTVGVILVLKVDWSRRDVPVPIPLTVISRLDLRKPESECIRMRRQLSGSPGRIPST